MTLHYAYFLATCLLCSLVFWSASVPFRSVGYADAVFMCVSAMTGAGLNTVDLSSLNTFQQLILFFLLMVGSHIIISSTVLHVRKRAFESKFHGISEARLRSRQQNAASFALSGNDAAGARLGRDGDGDGDGLWDASSPGPHAGHHRMPGLEDDRITLGNVKSPLRHPRVFQLAGVGARKDLNNDPRNVPPDPGSTFKGVLRGTQKYLFAPNGHDPISRNSQFHGLTPEEREQLGGVEYRAVSFLSVLVPLYFFSFFILGIVGVGSWLSAHRPDVARDNGLSPFFTGAFFAVSAFANSGMALLDANMTALQTRSATFCLLNKRKES